MENKTTYTKEYIEDRKNIDILAKSMQNQINQLNKRLTDIQITDFKLAINQAAGIKQKLPFKRKSYLWIVRTLAKITIFLKPIKSIITVNFGIIKRKLMLQSNKLKVVK